MSMTPQNGELQSQLDLALNSALGNTTESIAELVDAAGLEYLYNGKYGVSTDRNGLYYMRARYYDQDIKRFINRDVVSGDIANSQSLNRYCYVQGNPVSLTDPFGLCPTAEEIAKIEFRRKVHVALDIIGIFFDGADVINALLYMAEGEDIDAALCVVFLLPGVGSLAGLPIKYAMKLGGNIGESVLKLGKKFASELVENGSRFIRNIGGKIDDAGRWIRKKLTKLFGSENDIPNWEAHNVVNYAKYKKVLETTEAANPLVDSLRTTGKLPANYITKEDEMKKGWQPGKALNNYVTGAQIGGDIYENRTGILPDAIGRTWYEADIGLSNTISRSKQVGTRLIYSSDGLLYVTYDHYKTVYWIGTWK